MTLEYSENVDPVKSAMKELENMALDQRIKDQKNFLLKYYESEHFKSFLRREIYIYNMIINNNGSLRSSMIDYNNMGQMSENDKMIFDYIYYTKKYSLLNEKIKIISVKKSISGGISVGSIKDGKMQTTNIEGTDDDNFNDQVNELVLKGEINTFDVVLNNNSNLITSPIHELYHSGDNRLLNSQSSDLINQFINRRFKYFKGQVDLNHEENMKQSYIDYIFKSEELKAVMIEIKYLLYKLNIWDGKENIKKTHIEKLSNLKIPESYVKLKFSWNNLMNRIAITTGFNYNFESSKKIPGVDIEQLIQAENEVRLLLDLLMNSVSLSKTDASNING